MELISRIINKFRSSTPAPQPKKKCDLTIMLAASDGEWIGIRDLIDSIHTYIDCSYEILVIDDCSKDGTYEKTLDTGVWAVRNPKKMGVFGLDFTIRNGFYHALKMFDSKYYLKIDPDALFINGGFFHRVSEFFSSNPKVGLIGNFRYNPVGEKRDFSYWKNKMSVKRKLLEPALGHALSNGYNLGDGVQGGAYCLTRECLYAIYKMGYLTDWHPPYDREGRIAEDHITTMLVYSAGYTAEDFGQSNEPFAVSYESLAMPLDELLDDNRAIIHPIKYTDDTSTKIREFYREIRKRSH